MKVPRGGFIALLGLLTFTSVVAAENSLTLVDASFGRLFTYPSSRVRLDQYKNSGRQLDQSLIAATAQVEVTDSSRTRAVEVSGFIIGENGRHTVWINEGDGNESAQGSSTAKTGKPIENSKKVPVHAKRQSRFLKPGQVWLLDEHRVTERYELLEDVANESSVEQKASAEVDSADKDDLVNHEIPAAR